MTASPQQPIISFYSESSRFHRSCIFVLSAQLAALRDKESDLGKAERVLSDKVAPTYSDSGKYIIARLFVSHIAAFELFLQETFAMVIQKHPKKVGYVQFSLKEILDASDPSELVQRATENILNDLMYKTPKVYLEKFCDFLSIDGSGIKGDWSAFVEAKARRDLGVHNAWKCNSIYLRKVREAGLKTTLSVGDSVVPQDQAYLDKVDDSLNALAESITNLVFAKHWPELVFVQKPSVPNTETP